MWDRAWVEQVRKEMAALAGRDPGYPLTLEEGEGLSLEIRDGRAFLVAGDKSAVCRGLFHLMYAQEGTQLREKRHFRDLGVLVDVSRGAVLRPEAVSRLLRMLAALGMNFLMLYTEDTYTLEDYPYFGYLRGRYSPQDLSAFEKEAAFYGLEMVPCVQTLAHMGSFLQWNASIPLRDQPTILLADDEKVYDLIEAEVRAMRSVFSSRRIHIGMDEAASLGLGRYYAIHGPTDRFDLLSRHLSRVADICRRWGFTPMMWSDMFFRLGSKEQDYYDEQADIPDRVRRALPEDVQLCYWDYDHLDPAFYERMLRRHRAMGRPTVFAGAVHTWHGFLPHPQMTLDAMGSAMKACLACPPDTVMATIWGDDGNECDLFLALHLLPVFSEACWKGPGFRMEDAEAMGLRLTGFSPDLTHAMSAWFAGSFDRRTGKGLIWCDPLYPFLEYPDDSPEAFASRAESVLPRLSALPASPENTYVLSAFRCAAKKARLMTGIREAYACGDREGLRRLAEEAIPDLLVAYDSLMLSHRALWERDFKRNGWELLSLRYGASTGRLKDVQDEILRYVRGLLPCLPELDEAPLPSARKGGMQFYQTYVVPSHYL